MGLLKVGVLGAWAESIYLEAVNPQVLRDLTTLVIQFYMFPLSIYLNFSGYTDVMVGAGGLLGFKVPENFNHPYLGAMSWISGIGGTSASPTGSAIMSS